MRLMVDHVRSPIGTLCVVSDDAGALRALDFEDYAARMRHLLHLHYGAYSLTPAPAPDAITAPLRAYFHGDLGALAIVPVRTGGTAFQRTVWAALREIPPGSMTTYGQLAAAVGRPAAVRAVGRANGANPVVIVVPCHRVIGASDALTGYGGGLARKRWLLEHEGVAFTTASRIGGAIGGSPA